MVKRIDSDTIVEIYSSPTMLKEVMRFKHKNLAAIAEKMGGRQFYFVNKCLRVGLDDEDRRELAALKRSVDEVKVKKRNNGSNA